jgi:hypothetical protein
MSNFQRGWPDDIAPLPEFLTVQDADRKALRAFWRGSVFGALLAVGAFVGSAAWSGDTASFGGTGGTLVPVSGEAHVAEVRCRNVNTSGPYTDSGVMDAGDLTAHVTIVHGPGDKPDTFTITPQPGFVADPQVLVLDEWTDGTVRIYQFVGS